MKSFSDFEKMLNNYRLTTAEIIYHMPDHPVLLQSFIWQELDLVPDFPVLKKFLDFWDRELDGKVHSVKIAHCEIIQPNNYSFLSQEFKIN